MPVLSNPTSHDAATDRAERTVGEPDHPLPSVSTNGSGQVPSAASSATSRRRWPLVVAAIVVAGALGAGGYVWLQSGESVETTAPAVTLTAVTAETRDLIEFTDLDGRMVDADVTTITSSSDGVITEVIADGALVDRGAALYEVNSTPVIAFYGDFPLYRQLAVDTQGDDVLILEQNLASLGYHTVDELDDEDNLIDTGFTVDGVFDDATTEAVLRWQRDVGLPETGLVGPSDVLVIDGPSTVSNVAVEVGSRISAGQPLAEASALGRERAEYFSHGGDIDVLVAPGTELISGQIVYAVADLPITAVVTDEKLERTLEEGIADGTDVLVLEEMLLNFGYDADGDLDVDEEFDEFTEQAVRDWEEDLQDAYEEVEIDGRLTLDEIVVVEPGTVVGDVVSYDGDVVPNGAVFWITSESTSTRIVETTIDVADQEALTEGTPVDIEFPDGELAQGIVTSVASSSSVDPTDPDAEPTLAVEIELASVPASADGLIELDVAVKLVDELAAGATVVPVAALVATGDGGFAVEAVTTTGVTTRVAVEPGMFSDGWVEVTGIEPGTQVAVPS